MEAKPRLDGPTKLRLLDEYVAMYASRVLFAHEEEAKFRKVGIVATCTGKIVPDMDVRYLERDEIVKQIDLTQPGVHGAMSLFDRAEEANAPFLLIFSDGDVLATLVRARLADDPDAE